MTCLTCETTPPPEKLFPERLGPHHIGRRFGDGGLGLAVIWRGIDVTDNCVEALAGPPGAGWAELRVLNDDGTPTLHAAAPRCCPDCGAERAATDTDEDGCADCGSVEPTQRAWPAHAVSVIRHGHVFILRGTEIITGPPSSAPMPGPAAISGNDQVRAMISKLYESHPQLRDQQAEPDEIAEVAEPVREPATDRAS